MCERWYEWRLQITRCRFWERCYGREPAQPVFRFSDPWRERVRDAVGHLADALGGRQTVPRVRCGDGPEVQRAMHKLRAIE